VTGSLSERHRSPPGPPAGPAPGPGSGAIASASPAPPRPAPAPPRPQRASAPTASWDEPGSASPGPRAPVATAPPAARRSRPSPSGPERRIWNVPHPTAAIVRSSLPLRSDQPSVFIRSSRQEPWSSKKEDTEWPSGFPAPGGREPGDLPLRLSARHPHNAAIRVGSAQGPEAHGSIQRSRGQRSAIGGGLEGEDGVRVAFQDLEQRPIGHPPDFHGSLSTA
jgi:hypothetical protein